MIDKFRVGCFNGDYSGDIVEISHDSMDEPLEIDHQELSDLGDIIAMLNLRNHAEHGDEQAILKLKNLVDELEAKRED
jgi:hypothetical protein